MTLNTAETDAAIDRTEQLLDEFDRLLNAREQDRATQTQQTQQTQHKQQIESQNVTEAATTGNKATSGNNKPKSKNRAANQAAVQLLMETYPQTFSRNNVRPLKIGIQEDLLADDKVSKNKIKRALASYVRSLAYYRSLQAGAARIDLKGEPAGEVSEQEAEHARDKLKEANRQRREREQQRRAAQREQEKSERMNDKLQQLVSRTKR